MRYQYCWTPYDKIFGRKKRYSGRGKFPLRRQHIESIPEDLKGLYGFWCRSNGRCIYIGKAEKQSIRERLLQEWSSSHNEKLRLWIAVFGDDLDICYLHIVSQNRIEPMETKLIQMWNPEANIRKKRK